MVLGNVQFRHEELFYEPQYEIRCFYTNLYSEDSFTINGPNSYEAPINRCPQTIHTYIRTYTVYISMNQR